VITEPALAEERATGAMNQTLYPVIAVILLVGRLGEGLVSPALGVFLVDISEERHRARVMGIRTSASPLGGVLGPLLAAVTVRYLPPPSAFVGPVAIVLLGALLALLVLKESSRAGR
jgi:MFS family permease